MTRRPRIAIVSDPLVQRGGAERVVEAIADAFPEAPIFAILYSQKSGPRALADRIRPSYLQNVPGAASRHRWFFPFFPSAVESFDLSEFDVIVSSHHTAAKGLLRNAEQLHICYCHTPMRALWERSAAEILTLPAAIRPLAAASLGRLRVWDYAAAGRVDQFIANGRVTAARIDRHYGRTSLILNPPIDIARFTPGRTDEPAGRSYYLIASRAVAYKRIDIAINAAAALGRRVVVVGGDVKGPGMNPNVEYLGVVSDRRLLSLMRGATALLSPQFEDFGMAPLEVNACGRPVVAFGAGGALETVIDGRTGVLVPEQTVDSFMQGIQRLESLDLERATCRRHAVSFSRDTFMRRIADVVDDSWNSFDRRAVV